jgi:hypothetical protein
MQRRKEKIWKRRKKERRLKEQHRGKYGGKMGSKRKDKENNSNKGKENTFSWYLSSEMVNEGSTLFFAKFSSSVI